jgi:hypothetical protein
MFREKLSAGDNGGGKQRAQEEALEGDGDSGDEELWDQPEAELKGHH